MVLYNPTVLLAQYSCTYTVYSMHTVHSTQYVVSVQYEVCVQYAYCVYSVQYIQYTV